MSQREEEEAVGSATVARIAAVEQALLDCARHVFGKCDCPGTDSGQIYCAMKTQGALEPFVETVSEGGDFVFRLRGTADRSTTAVYGDNAEILQMLARAYRVHVSDVMDRAIGVLLDEAVLAEKMCDMAHAIRAMLGLPTIRPAPIGARIMPYNLIVPRPR